MAKTVAERATKDPAISVFKLLGGGNCLLKKRLPVQTITTWRLPHKAIIVFRHWKTCAPATEIEYDSVGMIAQFS
jgi:hypothetical protein